VKVRLLCLHRDRVSKSGSGLKEPMVHPVFWGSGSTNSVVELCFSVVKLRFRRATPKFYREDPEDAEHSGRMQEHPDPGPAVPPWRDKGTGPKLQPFPQNVLFRARARAQARGSGAGNRNRLSSAPRPSGPSRAVRNKETVRSYDFDPDPDSIFWCDKGTGLKLRSRALTSFTAKTQRTRSTPTGCTHDPLSRSRGPAVAGQRDRSEVATVRAKRPLSCSCACSSPAAAGLQGW